MSGHESVESLQRQILFLRDSRAETLCQLENCKDHANELSEALKALLMEEVTDHERHQATKVLLAYYKAGSNGDI